MNLNIESWKEFKLFPKYFDVIPGKYHYSEEYEEGNTPYVSASNENNGIQQLINLEPDFQGNCIITGKVGCTAFYQNEPFCATSDVNIFFPKFDMSSNIGLFLTTIINFNENYKRGYGRQCRVGNSKNMTIKLPVNSDGEPDRKFMEDYIKSLHSKRITTKNKPGKNELKTEEWKEFKVGDLFEVKNGKGLTQDEVEENPGDVEVIQGGESNNGSLGTISLDYCNTKKYIVIKEICLSVARVGTAGCINIQNKICAIGDKAKALILKHHKTLPIYLFLGTLLQSNSYKYSYGRGLVTESYMDTIIRLPVTPTGEPDREYMENYIKNLPYGDRI